MAVSFFGRQGYEALNVADVARGWQFANAAVADSDSRSAPRMRARSAGGSSRPSGNAAEMPTGSTNPDQFMLFQLNSGAEPLRDLTEVEPIIEGSDAEPDVSVSLSMTAFHIGKSHSNKLKENTRGTLRLDIGKDNNSNSTADALFWSIAAGLDFYKHVVSGANTRAPKNMNDDFSSKFRQRPASIPGGLAQLRIEIVEHTEPSWWRKALGFFAESNTAKLISSVGFPGIGADAVQLIDGILGRFEEDQARPILSSRPLTIAFSKIARDDFTAGSDLIRVGCVAPGYYALLRQQDIPLFRNDPPVFVGHTGHLVPKSAWDKGPTSVDPDRTAYSDLTYAIVRFRARGANLAGL